MDVRCSKCGIEYEFDDAKVTAAGVTVKCTSCGHVFKVRREEPAATLGPPTATLRADGEWMVKQQGGTVYRFKELTTLQKWIVERKVSRDDEISKTGRTWKRLGDVAELASFFQVVDAANAALQASLVAVQPAMSPTETKGAAAIAQSVTAIQLPRADGSLGAALPAASTPADGPAIASATRASLDAASAAPAAPAVPVRPTPAQASASEATLDDDDPVLAWQRAKRVRLRAATALLVLAAVAAVGWAARDSLSELLGGSTEPALAAEVIDGARAALRADRATARSAARVAIDEAAAAKAAPVEALVWQARFEIAEASEQRELARLHDALAALGGPDAASHVGAASAANVNADAALAKAYRQLGDVRARAPRLAELHLAAAAYQLEKGGFAELRGDLESARQAAEPADLAAIDAEIAAQQALAEARAALAAPDAAALLAAAQRIPQSDDARLLGARASLRVLALARQAAAQLPAAAADVEEARAQLAALDNTDERAALYRALLDAVEPRPPPVLLADAGPAAAIDAAVPVDERAAAQQLDAGPGRASASASADSYDVIMQKAEGARVNGKSRLAYQLFGKATKLQPATPRPWLGLGWAAMDLEKNAEAVRAFQRAVALSPGLGDAHFGLAEAYRFTGERARAVAEYQEFLRVDPGSRDAGVARRAIEALKE